MKRILFYLVCFWTLVCSCNKTHTDDLSGDGTMTGRLMLVDPVSVSTTATPLVKKRVVIRESSSTDAVNYLFSTSTDADGYFRFDNLKKNIEYSVDYEEVIGGALYESDYNRQTPRNDLAVVARLSKNKQNGIVLSVTDEMGNIVKEAEICVFASASTPGYINNICDGSSYQTKTDVNGKAVLFGMTSGTYFVLGNKTISGSIYSGKAEVTLNTEVKQLPIKLVMPTPKNGIALIVKDIQGNTIKEADVCVFKSSTSPGYINGLCDGSSYQLKTDINGEVKIPGIPQGVYYILGAKIIGQVPMSGRVSVDVGAAMTTATLTISGGSGIRFITTDVAGQAIGNTDICVFTSKILFDRDAACDGSNFQLITGHDGSYSKYGISSGTYYIFASKKIGTETWISKQTVVVGNEITECTLKLLKQ